MDKNKVNIKPYYKYNKSMCEFDISGIEIYEKKIKDLRANIKENYIAGSLVLLAGSGFIISDIINLDNTRFYCIIGASLMLMSTYEWFQVFNSKHHLKLYRKTLEATKKRVEDFDKENGKDKGTQKVIGTSKKHM